MELAVILLMFAAFLIFFKLLGVMFKASMFILTIPFQIIGAVFGVALILLLVPFAVLAGVITVLFAPLFVLGPFLPILLVIFGLYLIVRN